jgi:starch-binding outer membrane protein, SusD/RagB family
MQRLKLLYFILLTCFISSLSSCNKKDFLNEKPNTDILIPSTLDDFQTLLDNEPVMSETPVLGELSADNYYITNDLWQGLRSAEHNGYIWAKDIYNGEGNIGDWNKPYQQVFYSNVVLDGLAKVPVTTDNEQQWNTIKGSALFIRAYAFYNVAQVFAPVYDVSTASNDLGIPIRLNPAIDDVSKRATVKQTYEQILADLEEASQLLPPSVNTYYRNRPCKPAVFALLARVYLSMRQYDKAGTYADSCLQLYNALIDYNPLNKNTVLPFKWLNNETMYQSKINIATNVLQGITIPDCIADSTLYRSYDANDLRKIILFAINPFTGLPYLKGSYTGTVFLFSGLATDEVFLIRAECYARAENESAALDDLNTLLRYRIDSTFVPYTTSAVSDVLQLVLTERRKELPFRGIRWTDIRRLNKEGAQIKLKRIIGGQFYELSYPDLRFVLPIPPDVIKLSGITQNPR